MTRTGSVVIILGSPADAEWATRVSARLSNLGVAHETRVMSAHKTPGALLNFLEQRERTEESLVYITIAGRSNALSGFVDAQVASPVIACPPPSEAYGGLDVLSSLRMPRGVAPMVVLEAENAALAAAKILALEDESLRARVSESQSAERDRLNQASPAVGVGA